MTIHLSAIRPSLVQLDSIFGCFKDVALNDYSYLLSAAISQELRYGPEPKPTNTELNDCSIRRPIDINHAKLLTHEDEKEDTTRVHLQANQTLLAGITNDYPKLHAHKFDHLKVQLMPHLPELKEVIYDFYFYKFENDTDVRMGDKLHDQFIVEPRVARELEFFFLILAEECIHDKKFAESLMPEELSGKNIDISQVFYFMSEHFHDLQKASTATIYKKIRRR